MLDWLSMPLHQITKEARAMWLCLDNRKVSKYAMTTLKPSDQEVQYGLN